MEGFTIIEISFDHDLGEENDTGYDLACWIEHKAHQGVIKPMKWTIHSANPVGRSNIKAAMQSADRAWANQDE